MARSYGISRKRVLLKGNHCGSRWVSARRPLAVRLVFVDRDHQARSPSLVPLKFETCPVGVATHMGCHNSVVHLWRRVVVRSDCR